MGSEQSRLPKREYEVPILATLVELGGSGPMSVVIDRVGEKLHDRLMWSDVELGQLDEAKWRNRAQSAGNSLKDAGQLSSDSPKETWEITEAGRDRLAAEGEDPDTPKRSRARKGTLLPLSEYEVPILQALVELGGSGRTSAVVDRVGEMLHDQLMPLDSEPLNSGQIRWRYRARWARNRLIKAGEVKGDSPRGTWEITEAGRARLGAAAVGDLGSVPVKGQDGRSGERVGDSEVAPKRSRARKGSLLPQSEYEVPILETLVELGGSAAGSVVIDRVSEKLRNRLMPLDFEPFKSGGPPRWRHRTPWARYRLIKAGQVKGDSPRGIWEITELGRARLTGAAGGDPGSKPAPEEGR